MEVKNDFWLLSSYYPLCKLTIDDEIIKTQAIMTSSRYLRRNNDFWFYSRGDNFGDQLYHLDLGNFINNLYPNPSQKEVKIYPNPTSNYTNIEMEDFKAVEVIDLQGKVIIKSFNSTINLSQFNSGLYIFKVLDRLENVSYMRVIKNNF